MTREITDQHIKTILRNLTEFGYSSITEVEVREQVAILLRGEETSDIIGMFARDMLEEAGLLEN